MLKKVVVASLILVLFTLILSGCIDSFSLGDGSTTYVAHPTKIGFTISYGYRINCSGSGDYTINYDCDTPEVLRGSIISVTVNDDGYEDRVLATHNNMKSWNITDSETTDYNLGITATIISESYIVSDLSGKNALTIDEINEQYPDLVNQYCQAQANETKVIIDPFDTDILQTAYEILNSSNTNNSFLVAKELFIWLKKHTSYKIHEIGDNEVQSASVTYQCKTGDCDDLSFLYISLCRSIGIPTRFIRGFLVEEDNAIPHAWAEVFVGGGIGNNGWIPVECAGNSDNIETEVNQNFAVKNAERLRLFKGDGTNESMIISLKGISYSTYIPDRIIDSQAYLEVVNYEVIEEKQLVIDEDNYRSYQ